MVIRRYEFAMHHYLHEETCETVHYLELET